jgi:hypothetical protein
MTEAIGFTTFEDFLATATWRAVHHELAGGRVHVMDGGRERQDPLRSRPRRRR